MNIEKARRIDMCEILNKIGYKPQKTTASSVWFYSPFRNERTPSFKVNTRENLWYDFGEGQGGDTVRFVCEYLKCTGVNDTVPDALRWMRNMLSADILIRDLPPPCNNQPPVLILKQVKPLMHKGLITYLESRGISKEVAQTNLREVYLYNSETKKEYFAAGFKNEEEGYDFRSPFFKGCVKTKAVSFVRGTIYGHGGIHIFEGFIDFLSVITKRGGIPFEDDALILNSVYTLKEATGYMKNYGYRIAYTWLDNDKAGRKATIALAGFLSGEKIFHQPMNDRYEPCKDVNEALVNNSLKVSLPAIPKLR